MIKKMGFTLAEVLVTLGIIGVVASLTIPTLMKSYQKSQWIAEYKQTYSTISQATKMVMADNGGTMLGAWGGAYDNIGMRDAYEPHLKIVKFCGPHTAAQLGDCFADSYTDLNGDPAGISGQYSVTLSNGATLSFNAQGGASVTGVLNRIYIDTNGKKGPNVWGKDLHGIAIIINSDPVKPQHYYSSPTDILNNCPSDLSGQIGGNTCGIRILRGDYAEDY